MHVEVKGTTSDGAQVLLTAGEVKHHTTLSGVTSCLMVVHHIKLDGWSQARRASGGDIDRYEPWLMADGELTLLAYRYAIKNS